MMLVSAVPAMALGSNGEEDLPSPDTNPDMHIWYTDLGDSYAVNHAYPGYAREMNIPREYSGKPVTTLASESLYTEAEIFPGIYYTCTYYLPYTITSVEDHVIGDGSEFTLVFYGKAPVFGDNAFAGSSKITAEYPLSLAALASSPKGRAKSPAVALVR